MVIYLSAWLVFLTDVFLMAVVLGPWSIQFYTWKYSFSFSVFVFSLGFIEDIRARTIDRLMLLWIQISIN